MDLEAPLDAPETAAERQKRRRCCLKLSISGFLCVFCLGMVVIFQTTSSSASAAKASPLEQERQSQAEKFINGRIKALQGSSNAEKEAGVAMVLETMVDGLAAQPVLDIQAPAAVLVEGKDDIRKHLQKQKSGQPQFKDENLSAELVHGKPVIRFVVSEGRMARTEHRLEATFEFEEGSALIQKVTIKKDESTPLTALDRKRQQMVKKYMEGRIEAFQGSNRAEGVAKVLECFIPDEPTMKPIIDLHAPKKEYAEGREEIQHYLENPPNLPVKFKEGSNTDPVMVDGKAMIKFVMHIGFGFAGVDKNLVAVYEFKEGSDLVVKVTVDYDK